MMADDVGQPVTLDQFGDVLTDRDLARLMKRAERWPMNERCTAKRRGVAPDLPAEIPGVRSYRYRKQDVAYWLQTGRRSRQRAS